ncbi:hypothetical protein Acr_14g0006760 [Actinidia rufa]|uniref:Uncharacterized protein n=1 Tax=Actinidia rufa TaxID=165716 RepID=A0A7J0FQV6_9ERIC|nr:hypothetical protein Acr_14g0006760 [Actinidia rufa]
MANEVNQHPPPPEESSPQGRLPEIWTRIPRKGETVLSASDGEVAFYEAAFHAGLRCLYALLKGPGLESGWPYFKEFHLSIPWKEGVIRVLRSWGALGKRCNKMPALSKIEDERFCRVFEKIGEGGHFKIPVVLDSRTFPKYFAPGRVEMSSSGGGTAEGDIGGEAEGNIGGEAAASVGDASELSRFEDVPCPEVLLPVARAQALTLGQGLDQTLGLSPELRSDAMSKRIKLSQLAKVVAKRPPPLSSKGVVIFEVFKTTSKKRTLDDASKENKLPHCQRQREPKSAVLHNWSLCSCPFLGKAIRPSPSLARIWPSSFGKRIAKEAKAKNKKMERLEARVAELEKSQNLAKGRIAEFKELEDFQEAVMGSTSSYFGNGFDFYKRQLAHHYPDLDIDLDNIKIDRDFLTKEEAEAEEKERKVAEKRGEDEAGVEEGEKGD